MNAKSKGDSTTKIEYFKELADAVGLVAENGLNILSKQYEQIHNTREETALDCYLDLCNSVKTLLLPDIVIYPFGLNQSQKKAVENAFSSQISIIQGPPGTGKTQTILNIIANAVLNNKTVAVVSNNNSATHNVVEKLEKKELSFLAAFLGSKSNKTWFLNNQTGNYPNMALWELSKQEKDLLKKKISILSKTLNKMLNVKNRIAEIEQELFQLKPEQHYFNEYYNTNIEKLHEQTLTISSEKILSLWLEYEKYAEIDKKPNLLQKLFIMFRFNFSAIKFFSKTPDLVIPFLQQQFYIVREKELTVEKKQLETKLGHYSFEEKMQELSEKSLTLFRAELSERYNWKNERPKFEEKDFRGNSAIFNSEYPVILSTTYSIKHTLNANYVYDYLIIDEASQVDLTTGVLAFSCARNVVIVGDLQQLPNVIGNEDFRKSEDIWNKYSLPEAYHFSTHSLLSSALELWTDIPRILLREHYRCHPKIINFCNQKFYGGKLIVMTKDSQEDNVLNMYRTTLGSHARGHVNQRQIDIIKKEVLPNLKAYAYENIGIITPYRAQVAAMKAQFDDKLEIDTVHKFQGREKNAIILTSVDNVISNFVDDARMLNVAVSRAVNSLTVVISQNPRNDRTNYGDLARYIEYNNCAVIDSAVYSVFDLLYKGYAEKRRLFLQKHKKISEYDSENLLYAVIENILEKNEFDTVGCAVHVSLVNIIRDYSNMNEDELKYAKNPFTHVDFLFFRKLDRTPILAIEVDGAAFHAIGSVQAERDRKKDHIFEVCGIPLLRLRTDGSDENIKIEQALKVAINS